MAHAAFEEMARAKPFDDGAHWVWWHRVRFTRSRIGRRNEQIYGGRLLVNCENVFASKPAGGGLVAAKRRLNAAESEAVADGPLKQEGQKRPASRGRSKRDA